MNELTPMECWQSAKMWSIIFYALFQLGALFFLYLYLFDIPKWKP